MTKAYFCDICGKRFDTEELADKCEENCKAEKLKQEELAKDKDNRIKAINELATTLEKWIDDYKNDYGEYPIVVVSGKKNINALRSILDSCAVRNIFPWYFA